MKSIVSIEDVVKDFPLGKLVVHALRGVSVEIASGDFVTIAGPSGSGKTTLLNQIGCVDVPTSGTVRIDGQSTSTLSERKLTELRLHKLGFIFQTFNLVSVLNVAQNVELPLLLKGGMTKAERDRRVQEMLAHVDLEAQVKQRPNELSGGQRQRVAIARASGDSTCYRPGRRANSQSRFRNRWANYRCHEAIESRAKYNVHFFHPR